MKHYKYYKHISTEQIFIFWHSLKAGLVFIQMPLKKKIKSAKNIRQKDKY